MRELLKRFAAGEEDPIVLWRALVDALRPVHATDHEAATENLQSLIHVLTREPALQQAVRHALRSLCAERKLVSLLVASGLLPSTGFFSETARRISGRILPEEPDPTQLRDVLGLLFPRRADAVWVSAIPDELWCRLIALLLRPEALPGPGDATAKALLPSSGIHQLMEAVRILSYHISSLGLDPELLRIAPELEQHESPFLAQNAELLPYLSHFELHWSDSASFPGPDERQVQVLLAQCEEVVQRVRKRAAKLGTSLSLTFKLERLHQHQQRLNSLLAVLAKAGRSRDLSLQAPALTALLKELVSAECSKNDLGEYWQRNIQLLSLRVTENAGRAGEHYITTSRQEYFALFRSAAGAGLLIALMAALKLIVGKYDLAPLNMALLVSLNYALGFVLIHVLHGTVATKQPAMTANAIAASIGEASGKPRNLDNLVALTTRTLRSQVAAILGNILLAVPIAMLFAYLVRLLSGEHFVSVQKAQQLLQEVNPVASGAVVFAAIAGICLFLSGLVAGYYDNLCAYNRIPQRLRALGWARRLLGARRLERVAAYVEDNLGALAGNFFFGFMLGGVGALGVLFGLPLDIRHIAFSAAFIGYAGMAVDFQLSAIEWTTVIAGIVAIAVMNLGVSFSLALNVALRARGISFAQGKELLRSLGVHLMRRPQDFLFPPREASVAREQ